MVAMSIGRALVLTLLVLAMGGFGICSLCGGVMGISFLSEGRASSLDSAWLAFGLSALGALITWGCWWLFRRLRRPPSDK